MVMVVVVVMMMLMMLMMMMVMVMMMMFDDVALYISSVRFHHITHVVNYTFQVMNESQPPSSQSSSSSSPSSSSSAPCSSLAGDHLGPDGADPDHAHHPRRVSLQDRQLHLQVDLQPPRH
jgi:hypothetical protein